MALLALMVLLFLATHTIPALPWLRNGLIRLLGWRGYVVGYSALSIASLVGVAWAYRQAPYWPLWDHSLLLHWVPVLVMPLVMVLWVVGLASANPFSLSLWQEAEVHTLQAPRGVLAVVRHPVLWGFLLWALAHMAVNEDLASLVMFGLFALLAVMGMGGLDRKRRRQWGAASWQTAWQARRRWPLPRRQVVSIVAGLFLYAGFLFAHQALIGVSPWPVLP